MAESQTPSLDFSRSPREQNAFQAFCTFVLDPENPPPANNQHSAEYDRKLDELLFEILQSLFYRNLVPLNGITCLIDLILMLLWLKADGSAVLPSRATHDCAVFQYWAFTTVIHTLRLQLAKAQTYRECESTDFAGFNDIGDDDLDSANRFQKCVVSFVLVPVV